jgi:hypothetical protein
MVKVFVIDRVHKGHVILNCPQNVLYIVSEPIPCKLLSSTFEVKIEVGRFTAFLMSLFRIKPTIIFYREPGIYDVVIDGNNMIIHGVIEVKGNNIAIHPDIIYKDMAEYREVSKFVQDVYDKFMNTLNNAINLASVIGTAPLKYIDNLINSMSGATAMVQALGSHNVKLVELVNNALSGANISIDEIIHAINEVLSKARWLLAPPPPTQVFQAPPPMPAPPQQQQQQQRGGG